MKERDLSLDILRILACVMVVMMHAPIPSDSANGLIVSSVSYFTAPSIGLFFMVSGALLLSAHTKSARPSTAREFLRKRMSHVLLPTLSWTVFYLVLKVCDGEITVGELAKNVLSIPFSAQGHGVLWFMYTLAGLYLVTPILKSWLRYASEREVRFYLCLWLVSICYPILGKLVDINDSSTGILYYFSGYLGYYVLGYWLRNYGSRLNFKVASALMVCSVVAPVVVKILHWNVDFYSVFWYLSIFVAAQCVFWWKLVNLLAPKFKFGERATRWIVVLSSLTFGIYLSHIFIMRQLIWKVPFILRLHSSLLQILAVASSTLIISIALTYVISLSPAGKVIIGWRNKQPQK